MTTSDYYTEDKRISVRKHQRLLKTIYLRVLEENSQSPLPTGGREFFYVRECPNASASGLKRVI